jgi:putative zinc finger/helix-turn-helix YgiT family protein
MKSPFTDEEMSLHTEIRILTFRKENFEVWYHYFLCEDTQEQFTTTELDEVNINQCYNQYREKYTIPFPNQITKIREKYGINAAKMSEILGMEANSYRNYEQGEVPSLANGRLILVAGDPKEFQRF